MRGIGTDIIKIQRIRDILDHDSRAFVNKVFTPKEQEQANRRTDAVLYLATRFAGKEAVFKCLGLDGDSVHLNEIEILNKETGQPYVTLKGKTRELADKEGIQKVFISLSSDDGYAVAYAICE